MMKSSAIRVTVAALAFAAAAAFALAIALPVDVKVIAWGAGILLLVSAIGVIIAGLLRQRHPTPPGS